VLFKNSKFSIICSCAIGSSKNQTESLDDKKVKEPNLAKKQIGVTSDVPVPINV
jgi:hypothetical protein